MTLPAKSIDWFVMLVAAFLATGSILFAPACTLLYPSLVARVTFVQGFHGSDHFSPTEVRDPWGERYVTKELGQAPAGVASSKQVYSTGWNRVDEGGVGDDLIVLPCKLGNVQFLNSCAHAECVLSQVEALFLSIPRLFLALTVVLLAGHALSRLVARGRTRKSELLRSACVGTFVTLGFALVTLTGCVLDYTLPQMVLGELIGDLERVQLVRVEKALFATVLLLSCGVVHAIRGVAALA